MKDHYKGTDKRGHARSLYLNELAVMSENQLIVETGDQSFISAMLLEKPELDCHWRLMACADEWEKRPKNLYLDICIDIFDQEYGMDNYHSLQGTNYE